MNVAVSYQVSTSQRAVSTIEIEACCELALSRLQESLKRLMDTGEITRPGRGMYEPVTKHQPPCPISQTLLPDGTCKIDVGDSMMELTPLEHRTLVRMLGE